jgi:hypothetical protein
MEPFRKHTQAADTCMHTCKRVTRIIGFSSLSYRDPINSPGTKKGNARETVLSRSRLQGFLDPTMSTVSQRPFPPPSTHERQRDRAIYCFSGPRTPASVTHNGKLWPVGQRQGSRDVGRDRRPTGGQLGTGVYCAPEEKSCGRILNQPGLGA